MLYILDFFVGALLLNAIPHLASGLQGHPFPSPFAKPRGVGLSSPLVNVLWGIFNVAAGLLLWAWRPFAIGPNGGFAAAIAGALAIGIYLALHFGEVQRARGDAGATHGKP